MGGLLLRHGMPLIVGLGNPGSDYDGTPHNVGFAVVDLLAGRRNVRFKRSRVGGAEEAVIAGSPKTVILKPLCFMNRSGIPVQAALKWHGFEPTELIVTCDDVNLPFGHLRFRAKGGAGGQKGLASIIENLGTAEFARLRLGVGGGEPGADVADYVLRRFPAESRDAVKEMIERAATALECLLREGLTAAMNRFNTPGAPDEPGSRNDS